MTNIQNNCQPNKIHSKIYGNGIQFYSCIIIMNRNTIKIAYNPLLGIRIIYDESYSIF